MNELELNWQEATFVAFDTETTGAYPVGSEIVEFGAVKWKNGQIIDELSLLLKPREKMSEFIMGIHGISNEMVENAPLMIDEIDKILNFLKGSILIAHHAPFDMGFLQFDIERFKKSELSNLVICSSLLSRKFITGVENHKLQTLVKFLGIDGGSAHRAKDDAQACLYVALNCFEKLGNVKVRDILKHIHKDLNWKRYRLSGQSMKIDLMIEGAFYRKNIEISYEKGRSVDVRKVFPLGLVRNPDGDYLQAICGRDHQSKRFYFDKIKDVQVVF